MDRVTIVLSRSLGSVSPVIKHTTHRAMSTRLPQITHLESTASRPSPSQRRPSFVATVSSISTRVAVCSSPQVDSRGISSTSIRTTKFVLRTITSPSATDSVSTTLIHNILSRLKRIVGDKIADLSASSLRAGHGEVSRTPLRILPQASGIRASAGGLIAFQVFNASVAQCEAIERLLKNVDGVVACEEC